MSQTREAFERRAEAIANGPDDLATVHTDLQILVEDILNALSQEEIKAQNMAVMLRELVQDMRNRASGSLHGEAWLSEYADKIEALIRES